MDDYSDYSKNDEEDNDDGLDPGQSWLFFLFDGILVDQNSSGNDGDGLASQNRDDWFGKGKGKAGKSAHQFGQNV